jgi:hypothetical protein
VRVGVGRGRGRGAAPVTDKRGLRRSRAARPGGRAVGKPERGRAAGGLSGARDCVTGGESVAWWWVREVRVTTGF